MIRGLFVAALLLAAGPALAQGTARPAPPTVAAVLDACATDLKARCGAEPMALGRVSACLRRSTDALEPACRTFVAALSPARESRRESLRPARDAVTQACAADVTAACGADLTSRARAQCFRTHVDKMSEGCRSAMAELRRQQQARRAASAN
jgi:hypothetical protein